MRRSKLESYEDILGSLVNKPLNLDKIAYETSMDCDVVKKRLESLVSYGLVKVRVSGKKTLYAITERGLTVLKTLSFQKYLEKIANVVRVMDEALQTIPKISGSDQEKVKGT